MPAPIGRGMLPVGTSFGGVRRTIGTSLAGGLAAGGGSRAGATSTGLAGWPTGFTVTWRHC